MKNCRDSAQALQSSILSIVEHYKGNHANCDEKSNCQLPGYSPSKIPLTDQKAIDAYTNALKSTLMYKEASS
jgi:hypothetical protein